MSPGVAAGPRADQRLVRGGAVLLVTALVGVVFSLAGRAELPPASPFEFPLGAGPEPRDFSVVTTTEVHGIRFALVTYRVGGDVCWEVRDDRGGGGGGCGEAFRDEWVISPSVGGGTFSDDPWLPDSRVTVTRAGGPVSDAVASVVAEGAGGEELARVEPKNGGFLLVLPGDVRIERISAYDGSGALLRSVVTCSLGDPAELPPGLACES